MTKPAFTRPFRVLAALAIFAGQARAGGHAFDDRRAGLQGVDDVRELVALAEADEEKPSPDDEPSDTPAEPDDGDKPEENP